MKFGRGLFRETAFLILLFIAFVASGSVIVMTKSIWMLASCVIFSGLLTIQFVLLFHDCMHGSLFEKKSLHTLFGRIIGTVFLCPYHFIRYSHLKHHVHAGIDDEDTEILHFTKAQIDKSVFARVMNSISRSVLAPLLFAPLLQFVHLVKLFSEPRRSERKRKVVREIMVDVTLIAIFAASVSIFLLHQKNFLNAIIFAYLIPYMMGLALTYLATKPLHTLTIAGKVDGFSAEDRHFLVARTIDSNAVTRAVFFNLNFHLEHHLYPAVSRWDLGRISREKRSEIRERAARVGSPILIDRGYIEWYRKFSSLNLKFNPVVDVTTLRMYNS